MDMSTTTYTRVNRVDLLSKLESVSPGLSPKDIVEQSSKFVFSKGMIITYNDEIMCRTVSGLPKDIEGAVAAKPLLTLLGKLPEDIIQISFTDTELRIKGKRRSAGVKLDAVVTLPYHSVEPPVKDKWKPLADQFADAITVAQECVSKDQDDFALTCVHITSKYIEATDSYQIVRYRVPTGFESEFLIRGDSVKHVTALGVTHVNESPSWMHFKTPNKTYISVRRYTDTYPALGDYLKLKESEPAVLPKGLVTAAETANIFSAEAGDSNNLIVTLDRGRVTVEGLGVSGWYREVKKLAYNGTAIRFMISPAVLIEIVNKHNDCQIGDNKLMVDGGGWRYVTSLGDPSTKENKPEDDVTGMEE